MDVRTSLAKWLIIRWLLKGPATGYEIMKRYEAAFGRASPGTIYPLLSQLERKGIVRKNDEGKYELTQEGRSKIEEIEQRRAEIIEESRRRMHALADLLDDPYLHKLAEYMPIIDKVSPRVLDVLSDVEMLSFELGEKAIPVLDAARKRLEKIREAVGRD